MNILENIYRFDFSILNFIQEHLRCDFLDWLCRTFGYMGTAGLVWIVLSIVLLFFKKTRAAGVMALVSMGLVYLLGDCVIKPIVQRPRPFLTDSELNMFRDAPLFAPIPSGYSFPSGHSAVAATFATIMLIKDRVIGLIVLGPALFMLFSRLYNYVHFPTDVLCGALLGIAVAFLVYFVFRKTKLDKKLSPSAGSRA